MKKVKNIVISGTHFWNPGDDFVRDGVLNVLRNIYPSDEYQLNFLFYNFGPANKPQVRNIHSNLLSSGDLDNLKDYLDMIVIVGLSGGDEITDLYGWIDANNLNDKVYIIGGGYENDYINHFLNENDLTFKIFKGSKLITGRTSKYPNILNELKIPYHHIHCPALLSYGNGSEVLYVSKIDKKNIAFSIQAPHGTQYSVSNQSTGEDSVKLILDCFGELYNTGEYNIKIICHYKTEYFYFLEMFKKMGISDVHVEFSSFLGDTKKSYENVGIVISTRLHSCIYANSMGIGSILINNTPRHIETLDGIEFTKIVSNIDEFKTQFNFLSKVNQSAEILQFKNDLMDKYIKTWIEVL